MKLLDIYNQYPILVKAINFINLTNPSNQCPYHGIDHLFTVFKYAATLSGKYSDSRLHVLLAALFHDYSHKGSMGNDADNINKALYGVQLFHEAHPDFDLNLVNYLIKCTEFPYVIPESELTHDAKIMRDADLSYLLEEISIVKLYSGLRKEFGFNLTDFMNSQIGFFNTVKYHDSELQSLWANHIKADRIAELKILQANV